MEKRLPEGWEWKRLGDLITYKKGRKPDILLEQKDEGDLPYLTAGYFRTGTPKNFVPLDYHSRCVGCDLNDLVLIWDGSNAGDVFKGLNGVVASTMIKIEPKVYQFLPNFAFLFLKTQFQTLKSRTTGSSIPHISKSVFENLKVPLPPLETQRKIVSILEKADETKRLRIQADELTGQLLQSVFLEMFGDPVKNPNGWEMVKLGDFGDWTSGGTPSRTKPEYFQGNIPWFTAGELNDSYLLNSKERITEEALEVSAAKIFPKETMLIGMYDTAAFKMGLLLHPASSNQACAAFIPKKEELDSLFALHLFKAMKPVFLSKRRGVRQKNLSQSIIKNFEVPLPPFSLQTEFRQIVERVEKMRQNQKQTQQEIDNLFNTLMQKAFKGELVA